MRGGPRLIMRKSSMSHNPALSGLGSPGRGMQPPPPGPISLLPREMMLWGLVTQLQGPEAAGMRGSHRAWGRSEERGLLLEFVPLPQSQLAELFGRHGEHPGEVLCRQVPLQRDTRIG